MGIKQIEEKSNKYGIAALTLGILSLVLFLMPYIGLPLAILAIVFAAKQNKTNATGQASAGYILGIIGIVLNSIMLIFVLIALLFVASLPF